MSQAIPEFDLLIVGGGPAGLAAAIRARQCARDQPMSICVLDKGAEIGAHILSGAIVDPRALDELLPDWPQRAPLHTRVSTNTFLWLNESRAWQLPPALLPACMRNKDLYIGSLGELCRWLALEAEKLGIEIFPGFTGATLLQNSQGRVTGVMTGEMGRQRDGSPGARYQPGTPIHARYTLLAEGARGHLGLQAETLFNLRENADPQTFSLGLKELWRIPVGQHRPGLALHAAGWPLGRKTSGGAFCYHYGDGLVAIGLVAGLEYANPWLSPFDEFQRLKNHPGFRCMLEGGERLAFGARTLATGGLQSLPQLVFPGGALIGDTAGFLNAASGKGIHGAMKSGMLAAEAAVTALTAENPPDLLKDYPETLKHTWLHAELRRARNFKPALKLGPYLGSLLAGLDQTVLRGHAPWTLHNTADHSRLEAADEHRAIDYPAPDGKLSFDRASSVHLSNTRHAENQPCHLHLKAPHAAVELNLPTYAAPETRYCPTGVYEIVTENNTPRLVINAQNCLHCKACDIKDPTQNIVWMPPQGGEGPVYPAM